MRQQPRSPDSKETILTQYDDSNWHYGGDFPDDLPQAAAGTHIGMFVAWCLLTGFASEGVEDALETRETTPGAFLMDVLDERFVSDDLTADGNAFAVAYYAGRGDDSSFQSRSGRALNMGRLP